jgi:hypothetical protein
MLWLALIVTVILVAEILWAFGLLGSWFRPAPPSTAGLIAVPTPARVIPAYSRVTRDHLWDVRNNRLAVIYLPPGAVSKEMLRNLSDVIGRVVANDKSPGYVFTAADFLPPGTREGLVAGIPAGKRAVRVTGSRAHSGCTPATASIWWPRCPSTRVAGRKGSTWVACTGSSWRSRPASRTGRSKPRCG